MSESCPLDIIELRGIVVSGRHGALPGEQDQPQPFALDLDIEADLSVAGGTDALTDTVDYGAVTRIAARVVTDERWHLLERLAQRVADDVLNADGRIRGVTVVVRKLQPPVRELRSAGVRIVRRRPAPAAGADKGRRRAFLGLGANLGDREEALRRAVASLPDVVAVSPLYETEALEGAAGQAPYLNVVVELSTDKSPRQLLELARRLEDDAGRVRRERHGPRTLDVDVLWIDGVTVSEPDLVVPHPRLAGRRFVLAPLADLAPELVPPDWQETSSGTVRRVGTL